MNQHQHGHDASQGGGCGCGCGCGSKLVEGIAATMATDLVCGMKVDPATSKHRLDHASATYHFCSAGCQTVDTR